MIGAPAAGSPGEGAMRLRKDEPRLDGGVRKAWFLWSEAEQKAARMIKYKIWISPFHLKRGLFQPLVVL